MKQILCVSTSVLALAFIIAFYYYMINGDLTNGGQSQQAKGVVYAHASTATVNQPCNCSNVSFLNGPLFNAPAVQPPFRPGYGPLVSPYPYTGVETARVLPGLAKNSLQKETIAWNAPTKQARNSK